MPLAGQIINPDEFYPSDDNNQNGRFSPRTPNMLREAASEAALNTMERFREAARILAENQKEMAGMNCGITEGDSDRKRKAIKRLLQNDL